MSIQSDSNQGELPDTQISLLDRLSKFKKLRQRRNEGEKLNKHELYNEHKKQKAQSLQAKNLERKKIQAEAALERLEEEKKGENYERKKAWDWSIEDHEKWEVKLNEKESQKKMAGFQNYAQLAEQSYIKELKNLKVDQEDYEQQKSDLMKKFNIKDGQFTGIVDFTNKPSKEAIDRLVNNMDGSLQRKSKRRRNKDEDENVSSYINDKNKMFNQKLNRQYKDES